MTADERVIAFQLHAYISEANWAKRLFEAPDAIGASRIAIAHLLGGDGAAHEADVGRLSSALVARHRS